MKLDKNITVKKFLFVVLLKFHHIVKMTVFIVVFEKVIKMPNATDSHTMKY